MTLRKEPRPEKAAVTGRLGTPGSIHKPAEPTAFPNVASTSDAVKLVERACAHLFNQFCERPCESLVTVRVAVDHLRPAVCGASAVATAAFAGWEEPKPNKPPVIKANCQVSVTEDGRPWVIATAEVWLSVVCRINLDSRACLRLENSPVGAGRWALRDALSISRASWNKLGPGIELMDRGKPEPWQCPSAYLVALEHAIAHEENDLLSLWLKKSRNLLNDNDITFALRFAQARSNTTAVDLIAQKRRLDEKGASLRDAARRGNLAAVRALLAGGTDPHFGFHPGNNDSILHIAAYHGHTAVCEALLAGGAEINGDDEYGNTPLMQAIWGSGTHATVKLLLQKGASPNHTNDENWSSLHLAVKHGYPGLVTFLLQKGADATIKTAKRDTPLRLAARLGRKAAAQELLANGVDASLGEGCCTALEWLRGEKALTGLEGSDLCLRP